MKEAWRLSTLIDSKPKWKAVFGEGKMLGVLIAENSSDGRRQTLYAYSGSIPELENESFFVPPIFNLLDPKGYFKFEERSISLIHRELKLMNGWPLKQAQTRLTDLTRERDARLSVMREEMAKAKTEREQLRSRGDADEAELIRQSQFQKAEFHRAKLEWASKLETAQSCLQEIQETCEALKKEQSERSLALQSWLFSQYKLLNYRGEERSVEEIFSEKGLTPPGGTGDCAAPKLLQYAYSHGLKPLAMGEFWYGDSPAGRVRQHLRFYPSCTEKCGPLLGFMLQGLDIEEDTEEVENCRIVFENEDFVVADKPHALPSVPGKDGRKSLQELLEEKSGQRLYAVHRLDMDTAGLILFAKTPASQKNLQGLFAGREVRKTYEALLEYAPSALELPSRGRITLPLAEDYEERPRQKVDMAGGKPSVTEYEILSLSQAGVHVLFHPLTGRTHQLRVHSAHPLGLGLPIKGDRLYGSASSAPRLCLRAISLEFDSFRFELPREYGNENI